MRRHKSAIYYHFCYYYLEKQTVGGDLDSCKKERERELNKKRRSKKKWPNRMKSNDFTDW